MSTPRPTPPDLEFRAPDCPFCDKETSTDGDSFRCDNGCGVSWSTDGRRGEWDESSDAGCEPAIEPFNNDRLEPKNESVRHYVERCILPFDPDGHTHRAADSWYTWDDDDPRIVPLSEATS